MRKLCVLLAVTLLVLAGCAPEMTDTMPSESVHTSSQPTQPSTQAAPPPVEVSPLAVEDFLEFDKSSYPRENPVEFVMIHFTSAVMLDRENP